MFFFWFFWRLNTVRAALSTKSLRWHRSHIFVTGSRPKMDTTWCQTWYLFGRDMQAPHSTNNSIVNLFNHSIIYSFLHLFIYSINLNVSISHWVELSHRYGRQPRFDSQPKGKVTSTTSGKAILINFFIVNHSFKNSVLYSIIQSIIHSSI